VTRCQLEEHAGERERYELWEQRYLFDGARATLPSRAREDNLSHLFAISTDSYVEVVGHPGGLISSAHVPLARRVGLRRNWCTIIDVFPSTKLLSAWKFNPSSVPVNYHLVHTKQSRREDQSHEV
jgi:hypothetical protein